uniref:Uncharacterized protein n=1 Tax=Ignisphaera aggregans TaxID=334771 RepID=A0A7C5Z0N5_9CREN
MVKDLKIYRNSDVLKIVGFIPPGHRHMRLVIVLEDQVIVLQEATVAAIARAYIDIVSHPTRKAVEYTQVKLDKDARKSGYAEYQLIEDDKSEDQIIYEWCRDLNYCK